MRSYNHYAKALLERTLKIELNANTVDHKQTYSKSQLKVSEQIILICLQFMWTCQQPGAKGVLSLIQELGAKTYQL